ncbi:MAG: tRNA lysidine(34) synthetase TilS [Bacteroidales bacterium]|nr:tRNA lysidine(34) synthetase TilS [Bacteroidales bacterium]
MPDGGTLLAAVSGGIDSMTMLYLCRKAGINVVAAHCNFGLRGDESDADEVFVRKQTSALNIPVRVIRFATEDYATQNGISIQMAARELRYRWFEEVAAACGCCRIAVAHHRDDRIETLFINLARGAGVRGLAGMKPLSGNIIRPLLWASRAEIAGYASAENIPFREDSSNASDKYARNYIRHHLIPGMEKIFPGFCKAIERDIEHFSGAEAFYRESVERFISGAVCRQHDGLHVDFAGLMKSPSPATLLFEILQPFDFPRTIVEDILNAHTGRQFLSPTHRLVHDRRTLVVQPLKQSDMGEYSIDVGASALYHPVRMSIRTFDVSGGYVPETDPNVACLDGEKLNAPLLLRKWRKGDRFYPLGMRHGKKLSDFFTDMKLSTGDKEAVWILTSSGQIAWIAGYRIDDRYKITGNTRRVVRLEIML